MRSSLGPSSWYGYSQGKACSSAEPDKLRFRRIWGTHHGDVLDLTALEYGRELVGSLGRRTRLTRSAIDRNPLAGECGEDLAQGPTLNNLSHDDSPPSSAT